MRTALKNSGQPGFTLVELLIIVAILVALIATMIAIFDPFERKGEAYDAERGIHTRQIYKAINDYLWDQNYPPDYFPAEGEYKWICREELTGGDCTDNRASGGINSVDLSFLTNMPSASTPYMEHIPYDPVYANEQSTGFRLTMDGDYFIVDAPYSGAYHPPPDPIAWWKLDDTSIGTATESVGGYDGTHNGMNAANLTVDLPPTNLVNNRSIIFGGDNDFITIPDDSVFDVSNRLSITAWVKGDSTGSWGAGSDADIILRKGDDCPVVWEFAITDGKATLILGDGVTGGCEDGGNSYEGSTELQRAPAGDWYHVAATWDGSVVNIYVDGEIDGTYSHASQIGTDDDPVYIGGRTSKDYFDGFIDDVRLYDVPLTAEQAYLMAQGLF